MRNAGEHFCLVCIRRSLPKLSWCTPTSGKPYQQSVLTTGRQLWPTTSGASNLLALHPGHDQKIITSSHLPTTRVALVLPSALLLAPVVQLLPVVAGPVKVLRPPQWLHNSAQPQTASSTSNYAHCSSGPPGQWCSWEAPQVAGFLRWPHQWGDAQHCC